MTAAASFWKEAAKSLPEPLRNRYAGYFVAAERWECAWDIGLEAWCFAKQGLAGAFHAGARLFRAAAHFLYAAACRFFPTQ